MPAGFALQQNYPNPFNPSTIIEFQLPKSSIVSLVIYDIQGREVERLINNEMLPAAKHEISWTAQSLPSGIYFYRLMAGNYTETRRMMLLK